MNRLAFGAGVLVLAPVLSGCSNFYLTSPPPPLPTATPAPTAIEYPFDATQGLGVKAGQAILLNGTPTTHSAFRVTEPLDIHLGVGRANDPANATLLLTLQPLDEVTTTSPAVATGTGTSGSAGSPRAATGTGSSGSAGSTAPASASTTLVGGPKDKNPYRVAGIIVPGPSGRVGAGLQDADEQALQAEASRRMLETVSNWLRVTGVTVSTVPVAGATPQAGATPTGRPRPGAVVRSTPRVTSIIDPAQELDVQQDPQFPVDSENRPLVQVMFKSNGGNGFAAGKLSLNRMLVRSGWAVVDLYSPTSFDQQTWLLDEAYARHRSLGLWGLELNGKKLTLQQRIPAASTGTGALSRVPVTNNVPPRPGTPLRPTAPVASATQSPMTLTPTLAPSIPRVVRSSGTSVVRGSSRSVKLPPATGGTAPVTAPVPGTGSSSGMSNSASGSG
ncbi:hypothetical protein IAD21_05433 [Abditibacteriota bacterium]|nr:hypothetical protein IAD21_05433 [Abditibacteriota bacterium]